MTTPSFTVNLSPSIDTGPGSWDLHVLPLLADLKSVRWLEVGSYEGRSAMWILDHLLLDKPGSSITCVDPWSEIWSHSNPQEPLFNHNTAGDSRVVKRRGLSRDVLPTLTKESFHGIYIDGSHDEKDVRDDAAMAISLLAPGGVLIFDDYEELTLDGRPADRCYYGVNAAVKKFQAKHLFDLKAVWLGYQAIFQKRGRL